MTALQKEPAPDGKCRRSPGIWSRTPSDEINQATGVLVHVNLPVRRGILKHAGGPPRFHMLSPKVTFAFHLVRRTFEIEPGCSMHRKTPTPDDRSRRCQGPKPRSDFFLFGGDCGNQDLAKIRSRCRLRPCYPAAMRRLSRETLAS